MTARLSVLETQILGWANDGGNLLAVIDGSPRDSAPFVGLPVLRDRGNTLSLDPERPREVWSYRSVRRLPTY